MNFRVRAHSGEPVMVTFGNVGAGMQLLDGSMVGGQVAGVLTQGEDPAPLTFTPMEGDLPGDAGAAMFATSTGALGLAVTWARSGDTVTLDLARPTFPLIDVAYALFGGHHLLACHELFEEEPA